MPLSSSIHSWVLWPWCPSPPSPLPRTCRRRPARKRRPRCRLRLPGPPARPPRPRPRASGLRLGRRLGGRLVAAARLLGLGGPPRPRASASAGLCLCRRRRGRLARSAQPLLGDLPQLDREARDQRVQPAHQAGERRRRPCRRAGAWSTSRAGRRAIDVDLLDGQRPRRPCRPPLKLEQRRAARAKSRQRLGRDRGVAAHERERGRALEQLLQRLGAGLVGRALGERVLDDAERRVGVAQPARAARRPGARRCRGSRPRRSPRTRSICAAISSMTAAFWSLFIWSFVSVSVHDVMPARRRASRGARRRRLPRLHLPRTSASRPPGVSGEIESRLG